MRAAPATLRLAISCGANCGRELDDDTTRVELQIQRVCRIELPPVGGLRGGQHFGYRLGLRVGGNRERSQRERGEERWMIARREPSGSGCVV